MSRSNHGYKLAARPVGLPDRDDWEYFEEEVAEPEEGQILVEVAYISLDPAMRGWINEGRSYVPPVGIGEVMRALGIGRVAASRHPDFAEGDTVSGLFGVQERAISDGGGLIKLDPSLAPLPRFLGALGMPGMTAYFGLLEVGRPEPGETVVVSAAAGAVGAVTGQIAKLKGCRAVGIAGGEEKCRYVSEELGFDAAVDYKADDVAKALAEACPDGIDVYFDNVGGEVLDAALTLLNRHARVVICGAISQYNNTGPMRGPSNYMSLLVNHASMTGFVVTEYFGRYAEAAAEMAGWIAEGKVKAREDVVEGIETFPETLLKLYSGANHGKLVLKVSGED